MQIRTNEDYDRQLYGTASLEISVHEYVVSKTLTTQHRLDLILRESLRYATSFQEKRKMMERFLQRDWVSVTIGVVT